MKIIKYMMPIMIIIAVFVIIENYLRKVGRFQLFTIHSIMIRFMV